VLRFVVAISLLTSPVFAQEFMSPDEFQSYANGKTLYFAQQGQPYGVEQYLPGQQSIWQYADGTCAHGLWYAREEQICFIYEGDSTEQCWRFLRKGDGFAARANGREPAADLDVIWRDEVPIQCTAPDLGV
jgi:hypothetical protein